MEKKKGKQGSKPSSPSAALLALGDDNPNEALISKLMTQVNRKVPKWVFRDT